MGLDNADPGHIDEMSGLNAKDHIRMKYGYMKKVVEKQGGKWRDHGLSAVHGAMTWR